MPTKSALRLLFCGIFLILLSYTLFAAGHQPLLQWGGLTSEPDHYWTTATLLDAYFGFLTFYTWVYYKEMRWSRRIGWFVAIMLLGNIAMSAYVLLQLWRLAPEQSAAGMLSARNP